MDESVSCPQKPTGNSAFKRWISALVDYIKSLAPHGGKFINVQRLQSGAFIDLNISAIMEYISAASSSGSASDSEYTGPFKLKVVAGSDDDGNTTYTVNIVDGASEGGVYCGLYRHGIETTRIPKPSGISISGSCEIWVNITRSGSTCAFEFSAQSIGAVPASSDGSIFVKVGSIIISDGTVTVSQNLRTDLMTPGVG